MVKKGSVDQFQKRQAGMEARGAMIFLNHGWHGLTRIGREAQGCAWQAKLAMRFQIPSQASLHGIVKPHRSFCYANGPAFYASRKMWKIEKNTGLRLVSKRGDVVKKHLQARLRVSFPQQLQHSRSESTPVFSLFLSVYIFPIRG